jgi:hypothetical protein
MWTGHAISCFMLRQMEFDADRHTARLVGSSGFESMSRELSHLSVAYQKTLFDLGASWREGRLVDSVPALVRHNRQRLAPDLRERVRRGLEERKTGLFDTHPADRDRIVTARREGEDAVFRSTLPARVLFRDFEALARDVSLAFYSAQLATPVRPEALVSADRMVERAERQAMEQEASRRMFQGALHFSRPLVVRREAQDEPVEAEALRRDLEDVRSRLESGAAEYREVLERFTAADEHTGAETPAQRQLAATLAPFEAAAARRLELDLRALSVPGLVPRDERLAACEAELPALVAVARAIGGDFGCLTALRAGLERGAALGAVAQKNRSDQGAVDRFVKEAQGLHPLLSRLAERWAGVLYPFEHADEHATLGSYAVPARPDVNDVGSLFRLTQETLNRSFELYQRTLGRLAFIGERVEEKLGFEPLPAPDPEVS